MMGDISCILRLLFFCWQSRQPIYYFSTSQQPEMETLCTFNKDKVFGGRHRTEEKTTSVCELYVCFFL